MPLLSFCLFFFFLFPSAGAKLYGRPAEVTAAAKCAMRIELVDQTAPPRILGCLALRGLHWSGQLSSRAHVQHIVPAKAQESHREGGRNERETAQGETRQREEELRGRTEPQERFCGSTYICSHRPTNSRADTPDTWAL